MRSPRRPPGRAGGGESRPLSLEDPARQVLDELSARIEAGALRPERPGDGR
ncbi:MAG TPA: hypothetical protein VNT60_07460 [Deinococcales bacterium]|nr:hypothetical protein [Deinococcales bacterium]